MYIITINCKPATISKLYENERKVGYELDNSESYIIGKTKKYVLDQYIFHFGFTWAERPKNVNALKCFIITEK